MVSNDIRDGRSVEPGVDKGEVVRTHCSQTVSVLVDERGLKNRVGGIVREEHDNRTISDSRGSSRVNRPFSFASSISDSEEQDSDGVGESMSMLEGLVGS